MRMIHSGLRKNFVGCGPPPESPAEPQPDENKLLAELRKLRNRRAVLDRFGDFCRRILFKYLRSAAEVLCPNRWCFKHFGIGSLSNKTQMINLGACLGLARLLSSEQHRTKGLAGERSRAIGEAPPLQILSGKDPKRVTRRRLERSRASLEARSVGLNEDWNQAVAEAETRVLPAEER